MRDKRKKRKKKKLPSEQRPLDEQPNEGQGPPTEERPFAEHDPESTLTEMSPGGN